MKPSTSARFASLLFVALLSAVAPGCRRSTACEQAPSATELGSLLDDCGAGKATACAMLSSCYARGNGVPVDELAERAFAARACTLGDRNACAVPGADEKALLAAVEKQASRPHRPFEPFPECPGVTIHRPVASLSTEAVAALVRTRTACEKGNDDACVEAAGLTLSPSPETGTVPDQPELVPRDLVRAARLLDAPCKKGNARACGLAAWARFDRDAMKKSCDLGYKPACRAVPRLSYEDWRSTLGDECAEGNYFACAAVWSDSAPPSSDELQRAHADCSRGVLSACRALQNLPNTANSAGIDLQRLYSSACEKGNMPACREAKSLDRACAAGDEEACRRLATDAVTDAPKVNATLCARGYPAFCPGDSGRTPHHDHRSFELGDVACGDEGCKLGDWTANDADFEASAAACADSSYQRLGLFNYACTAAMLDLQATRPKDASCAVALSRRACAHIGSCWTCLLAKEPNP